MLTIDSGLIQTNPIKHMLIWRTARYQNHDNRNDNDEPIPDHNDLLNID